MNFAKPSLVNNKIPKIICNIINAIDTLTINDIPKHIAKSLSVGHPIN